jgi:N-acetylneuraminic acid mutarotase
MNDPRADHAATYLNGTIYVVGGQDNDGRILSSALAYNVDLKRWTSIANMTQGRFLPGMVAIDRNIYVVGGTDYNENILASMEAYNVDSQKWLKVASMKVARYSFGIASLAQKIYISGGFPDTATTEVYDTVSDTWEFVSASMKTGRWALGMAAVGSSLFVVGGSGNVLGTPDNERLNVTEPNASWIPIANIMYPRSGVSVVALQNCLFAAGGYLQGRRFAGATNVVEVYDLLMRSWLTIAPMNTARNALACVAENHSVICIGGSDANNKMLNSMEIYK